MENIQDEISRYYRLSQRAYLNWGRDCEREGIYSLHCGYQPTDVQLEHYRSVKLLTEKVVQLGDLQFDMRVLDAGCGTGSIAFEIAENFPDIQVVGINISPEQLLSAQTYKIKSQVKNATFLLQDFCNTGFKGEVFDRVFMCESSTHAPDKGLLLGEVDRILKCAGEIIVVDIFLKDWNLSQSQMWDLDRLEKGFILPNINTINEFRQKLEESGFVDVKFEDVTTNVIVSVRDMSLNAQYRLEQGVAAERQIHLSRLAMVAGYKLMKDGKLGYYFITAQKDIGK